MKKGRGADAPKTASVEGPVTYVERLGDGEAVLKFEHVKKKEERRRRSKTRKRTSVGLYLNSSGDCRAECKSRYVKIFRRARSTTDLHGHLRIAHLSAQMGERGPSLLFMPRNNKKKNQCIKLSFYENND